MKVTVFGKKAEKLKSLRDIFALFYNDVAIDFQSVSLNDTDSQQILNFQEEYINEALIVNLDLQDKSTNQKYSELIRELVLDREEIENQLKRMARLATYKILLRMTGKNPVPWGILTGVRPTKIVHRLLDRKWPQEKVRNHLIDFYEVSHDKANLLLNVVKRQRPYLLSREAARDSYSIYLGIPFCPSRCSYCSFPAYSLEKQGHFVEPFLAALHKEIEAIGNFLETKGKEVQTVYLGGGTPTSLNEIQLESLLKAIKARLISDKTHEFTVEAGRPDSISKRKLQLMKEFDASRISINPQTMNQSTLETIGRNHSPQDIVESFNLARALGFNNINMDLIIGLPGETLKEIKSTMDQIMGLNPENITVHTLALKRASRLNLQGYNSSEESESAEPREMLDIVMEKAEDMGMHPYYLYRQKQMRGQLENIGYAKDGFDCLYNIQMMEERQTIIGLGAGSGSKLVNCQDWTLESVYNPKDPLNYIERIDEIIQKKLNRLEGLS